MQIHYGLYMNSTGYSISSQDYILAMLQVDPDLEMKVHFLNVATKMGVSPNRHQIFMALSKTKLEDGHINIYHSIPHRYRRPRGPKKHIGFCIFETMNPPKGWIDMMNEMDAIITASQFNKRIFEANGVTVPVHVVPHTFDNKLFNANVKPTGRYGLTTFMSIGTWKLRKNWEGLVKAFYDAFEKQDNVCLLIKTDKPTEFTSMVTRVKRTCEWRSKETAPIYVEQKTHCSFEDIPKFMKKADFYISPTLGEGFNLGGLQAMALGIPLLITKFGGPLEYAHEDLCTYIEPKHYKTYPTMDGIPQFKNCIWPVIRIGEIKDKMRAVLAGYPKEKTEKAYKFVHEKFSYETIGKKFLEVLQGC